MDPTYPPPTELEWAQADVQVLRITEPPLIGLRKDVRKNDVPYSQTVWLTMTQMRAVAIDNAL